MTFTGRIRWYLVAIALLPPVLMMAVVHFYSLRQEQITYRQNAQTDLRRMIALRDGFKRDLAQNLENAARSEWFARVSYEASVSDAPVAIDPSQFDFDFVELLDHNNTVLASRHRHGLVGEQIDLSNAARYSDRIALQESVEYDISGRHAAFAGRVEGAGVVSLYAGWYLDQRLQPTLEQVMRGNTRLVFADDTTESEIDYAGMEFGSLYEHDDRYEALVSGNADAGFVMVADFAPTEMASVFTSFLDVMSIVAIVSVLAAIGLGIYISGRAKREIDNLVDAFGRVAGGDLSTPVMAYEEGEFAKLADSFSEMMQKLKKSQQQLATTQRIAAWQSMARKIAHEIKNPLTPIAISADDLRRSYAEKLPGFDETLKNSTQMIKDETNRLARILDEFSKFARMAAAEPRDVPAGELLSGLQSLYAEQIKSGT
ncbi:HAMP domain-containing protein, partial [candidate division GN15 bacterium]|nr:HAMP domain-containing protein [candidate division GN15 bacterium]